MPYLHHITGSIKMTDLIEKVSALNDLILQGQTLEALDRFYHDQVQIQDSKAQNCPEKLLNKQNKKAFFSEITEFRSGQPLKVAIGEKITMVEWYFDFLHKQLGHQQYNMLAVQEWLGGKIIKEKYYYESIN